MFSAKTYSLAAIAAAALAIGVLPGYSATDNLIRLAEQQVEPANTEQPATEEQPAAGDAAAPEAEGAQDDQASPAQEGSDATAPASEDQAPAAATEGTPETHDNAASPEDGASEAPAAESEPSAPAPASSSVEASQLKIGAAVLGSDGAKIGEINGVKSDTDGKVQEILVTAGTAAGINAQVYAVPGDKITEVGDGVKLSITSDEAKQLPIIDNSEG